MKTVNEMGGSDFDPRSSPNFNQEITVTSNGLKKFRHFVQKVSKKCPVVKTKMLFLQLAEFKKDFETFLFLLRRGSRETNFQSDMTPFSTRFKISQQKKANGYFLTDQTKWHFLYTHSHLVTQSPFTSNFKSTAPLQAETKIDLGKVLVANN